MVKATFIFLFLLLARQAGGQYVSPQTQQQQQQQKTDDLAAACIRSAQKDKVCEGLINFQQLGYDTVEIIKEYIHLGPFEYAAMTAINYAINGRVRIRTQSFIWPKWRHVYDFKQDGTMFYLERNF